MFFFCAWKNYFDATTGRQSVHHTCVWHSVVYIYMCVCVCVCVCVQMKI